MLTRHLLPTLALVLTAIPACVGGSDLDNACDHDTDGLERVGGAESNLYVATGSIWPSTSISVCWVNPTSAEASDRALVQSQIEATWEKVSNVNFTGWGACPYSTRTENVNNNAADVIIDTDDNFSPAVYGGLGKNMSYMELTFGYDSYNTWCHDSESQRQNCLRNNATHEFGHVLGFAHEANRPDSQCSETQGSNGNRTIGEYDADSVMNYCNDDRWYNGAPLSTSDRLGVRVMYGVAYSDVEDMDEDYDLKGDLTNILVGDFNGDGLQDFIRQEKGSWDDDADNTCNVFLSNGTGSFTKVTLSEDFDLKGDYTNLYVGDFNGDGKDDFLRQEKGSWDDDQDNTVNIFYSTGNGTFSKVTLSESYDLKGDYTNLYVGDFNGDGKDDFLRQEKGSWDDDSNNTFNVFFSGGSATFTKVTLSDSYDLKGDYTNIFVGDFNGDGKDDFLRQEKGAWDDNTINTANVFFSNGNGTFNVVTPNWFDDLKGDYTNIFVGDFNGDGKDDFLRQEKGSWDDDDNKTFEVWVSNGSGGFTIKGNNDHYEVMKGDYTNVFVGDFDADGRADFLRQEKGSWDNGEDNTANMWFSTL